MTSMVPRAVLCQSGPAHQALPHTISRGAVVPRPQCLCSPRQPQSCTSRRSRGHPQPHICRAAATAPTGKLLSKSEVPAFIPREDLIDQLLRWSLINAQEEGVAQFGLPMKVSRQQETNTVSAFKVTVLSREGATLTDIGLNFDDESSNKYDWLGRGADGFPSVEGEPTEIAGKHLEIRQGTPLYYSAVGEPACSHIPAGAELGCRAGNSMTTLLMISSEQPSRPSAWASQQPSTDTM